MPSPEDQLPPIGYDREQSAPDIARGLWALGGSVIHCVGHQSQWLAWSSLSLPPWLRWLGVPGAIAAVWLGYLAHGTLGFNYTPDLRTKVGHRVVANGIYASIRHPMYTSFFALLATCFLLTANWLSAYWGWLSLLIVGQAGHKGQMLIDRVGDEYRAYPRAAPGDSCHT